MKKFNAGALATGFCIVMAMIGAFIGGRVSVPPIVPLPGEVLISEGQPVQINVTRPTVLSVVMEDDDQAQQRCLDMGGWMEDNICRNVDY